MKKGLALILIMSFCYAGTLSAGEKIVTTRKTQSIDFEGDTVDGVARRPEGAYLVQKRSVDFVPLYKVRERFDENIRSSIDYLK